MPKYNCKQTCVYEGVKYEAGQEYDLDKDTHEQVADCFEKSSKSKKDDKDEE